MKYGLLMLAFLFLFMGGTGLITGKVAEVNEGDFIKVKMKDGAYQWVRLYGVDAPDLGQTFSSQSKKFTTEFCYGKEVKVVVRDNKRNRVVLGDVLVNGRSLNQALLSQGYAWWDEKHAPNDTHLKNLQAQAKKAKKGLWADPDAMAPWVWRRKQ